MNKLPEAGVGQQARGKDGPSGAVFCWMIFLVSAGTIFLDYWSYSRESAASSDAWMALLHGAGPAPEQYRVGVLWCAALGLRFAHLPLRYGITLIDCCSLVAVLILTTRLLRSSAIWLRSSPLQQWLGLATFVALAEYWLHWLNWYQRPETLPAALLCVLILGLASSTGARPALKVVMMLIVSAALGFVRADAGFALGLGFACAAWMKHRMAASLGPAISPSRTTLFVAGLGGALLCAAVQLTMMRVVYPHANYEGIPVFQAVRNFKYAHRLLPFALFMAPVAWVSVQAAQHRFALTRVQVGLMMGAAIFLVLWFFLGRVEEVRIFMPFALALLPLTVQTVMQRLEVMQAGPVS